MSKKFLTQSQLDTFLALVAGVKEFDERGAYDYVIRFLEDVISRFSEGGLSPSTTSLQSNLDSHDKDKYHLMMEKLNSLQKLVEKDAKLLAACFSQVFHERRTNDHKDKDGREENFGLEHLRDSLSSLFMGGIQERFIKEITRCFPEINPNPTNFSKSNLDFSRPNDSILAGPAPQDVNKRLTPEMLEKMAEIESAIRVKNFYLFIEDAYQLIIAFEQAALADNLRASKFDPANYDSLKRRYLRSSEVYKNAINEAIELIIRENDEIKKRECAKFINDKFKEYIQKEIEVKLKKEYKDKKFSDGEDFFYSVLRVCEEIIENETTPGVSKDRVHANNAASIRDEIFNYFTVGKIPQGFGIKNLELLLQQQEKLNIKKEQALAKRKTKNNAGEKELEKGHEEENPRDGVKKNAGEEADSEKRREKGKEKQRDEHSITNPDQKAVVDFTQNHLVKTIETTISGLLELGKEYRAKRSGVGYFFGDMWNNLAKGNTSSRKKRTDTISSLNKKSFQKFLDCLGYSCVLMSKTKPTKVNNIAFGMIVMHKTKGQLTAYWVEKEKIVSKTLREEEVTDIIKLLPNIGQKLNNSVLIEKITSKYGCARLKLSSEQIQEQNQKPNFSSIRSLIYSCNRHLAPSLKVPTAKYDERFKIDASVIDEPHSKLRDTVIKMMGELRKKLGENAAALEIQFLEENEKYDFYYELNYATNYKIKDYIQNKYLHNLDRWWGKLANAVTDWKNVKKNRTDFINEILVKLMKCRTEQNYIDLLKMAFDEIATIKNKASAGHFFDRRYIEVIKEMCLQVIQEHIITDNEFKLNFTTHHLTIVHGIMKGLPIDNPALQTDLEQEIEQKKALDNKKPYQDFVQENNRTSQELSESEKRERKKLAKEEKLKLFVDTLIAKLECDLIAEMAISTGRFKLNNRDIGFIAQFGAAIISHASFLPGVEGVANAVRVVGDYVDTEMQISDAENMQEQVGENGGLINSLQIINAVTNNLAFKFQPQIKRMKNEEDVKRFAEFCFLQIKAAEQKNAKDKKVIMTANGIGICEYLVGAVFQENKKLTSVPFLDDHFHGSKTDDSYLGNYSFQEMVYNVQFRYNKEKNANKIDDEKEKRKEKEPLNKSGTDVPEEIRENYSVEEWKKYRYIRFGGDSTEFRSYIGRCGNVYGEAPVSKLTY